ncbi:hypothetical protein B0J13DRAFT_90870 [Dactylonectria estremocensis]|uniref:Phosphatidate phosphatase APP1 catalytic domain-containing protein n=1 Tax=Dactylonectria estremocensis TaxID=1079267 RepID=A0A9P9IXQ1_9HYPO|nr:hypothetical protein B0J13DRAFT_90870 [Dactylonectria estremocensis]
MAVLQSSPSADAHAMQLRTRKQNKFDEVEAELPDPKAPSLQRPLYTFPLSSLPFGSWFSRLGSFPRFGKPVDGDDVVWLFDNTAYRSPDNGEWEAEFIAAVFEPDLKCHLADIVSSIAKMLGLADDADERDTIEERLIPFLWDIQTVRVFKVDHRGKELKLGPTSINGITSQVLPIKRYHKGSFVKGKAQVPSGVKGILEMQTYYAGPEGWSIISDIDDTIKITLTSDPLGILRETFVEEPRPVPGMPELYADIKSLLPRDTPWFYLSASPYNLYPLLHEFRNRYFPPGTMILRDSSWRSVAGLLSALTVATEEYKADRMKKIYEWLPQRKMILIGDSTQSDPEAYGEIYRAKPGWVKMILIRKATDISSFGIDEKNQLERFEKAFKDIPPEDWHVFEDPKECSMIVRKLVRRSRK